MSSFLTPVTILFISFSFFHADEVCGQVSVLPDAIPTGTGVNYLPYPDGEVQNVWFNQAGLASLLHPQAVVFATLPFGTPDLTHLGMAATFPFGGGGGGFSMQRLGNGNYHIQQIGMAYGRKLYESLYVGARWTILQTRLPGSEKPLGIGADIGLVSKIGSRLQFGIHVAHILSAGKSHPVVVHVGMGYKSSEKVFLAIEVEKDVDFPPDLRVGMAYRPSESLFLRFGSAVNPAKANFGVGYLLPRDLSLDFAVEMHATLGLIPSIGITYSKNKIP
jgi:hypothetical protein